MITISAKECVLIGIVTILCAFLIQTIILIFGEEDIKEYNLFYKHRNSYTFYSTLFIIGILIHIFIKYIEYNQWYCVKECVNNSCKVLCTLPFNEFTKILITA